jgi:serine phosphatase RsbU (regulator of sigma subunit)
MVAASGGSDRLSERSAPAELLRLLDQTRSALAETRDRLADSEHRAARDHELALRLQRAIMAPDIRRTVIAGLDIAARCRPSRPGFLVAGDWCDALALPGGDLLLVVGDIAGHGIDAVAGMVAARNALRGLAATGAEPDQLMESLNRAACVFPEEITGTVICGRYTPCRRELRWARAGHLPLVLIRGGTALVQPMPEGMLLGVHPDCVYQQQRLPLDPADTLLFFTDGMIERRATPISDALAEFAATASPVGADLDDYVTDLLAKAASDTGDDACLLAVRVR